VTLSLAPLVDIEGGGTVSGFVSSVGTVERGTRVCSPL